MNPSTASDCSIDPTIVENLRLRKLFLNGLQKSCSILFIILMVTSFAYSCALLYIYQLWANIDKLTNTFPAFFGFMSAAVLSFIGSCCGIASFSDNDGNQMDIYHSQATWMILTASIVFNIIFPTSGLMPLEIDSRRRIPQTPVLDCAELTLTLNERLPECVHARKVEICYYAMYPLILLEVIALVPYIYLKRQNDLEFSKTEYDDMLDEFDTQATTTVAVGAEDVKQSQPLTINPLQKPEPPPPTGIASQILSNPTIKNWQTSSGAALKTQSAPIDVDRPMEKVKKGVTTKNQ